MKKINDMLVSANVDEVEESPPKWPSVDEAMIAVREEVESILAPLRALSVDEMTDDNAASFTAAVDKAMEWRREALTRRRGLSFVISGPVGIGKTTIMKSLANSSVYVYFVTSPSGGIEDYTLVSQSRFLDAPTLIRDLENTEIGRVLVGDSRWSKQRDGEFPIKALFIDDLGREGTIPFVASADQDEERQRRYWSLFDFCYEKKVSLVISSNVPLIGIDGGFNPEFVGIIGEAAFDRLVEMAPAGFMFDLSGLPSARHGLGGR